MTRRSLYWFGISVIAAVTIVGLLIWWAWEAKIDFRPYEVDRRPDWVDPSHTVAVPLGEGTRVWMTPDQARSLGLI